MAIRKTTRTRKRHTTKFLRFPEVKGKIISGVEIDPGTKAIMILFQDRTALSFDLDPGLTVYPELSDRRDGDWRSIKRWQAMHSSPSMVKWP